MGKDAHGANESTSKNLNRLRYAFLTWLVARLCNDSHIVDERRVKRATIGTVFAKSKSKQNDKLNFAEFHTFIKLLSQARYPKVLLIANTVGKMLSY